MAVLHKSKIGYHYDVLLIQFNLICINVLCKFSQICRNSLLISQTDFFGPTRDIHVDRCVIYVSGPTNLSLHQLIQILRWYNQMLFYDFLETE